MKYIVLLPILVTLAISDILSINSFEADFIQSVKDDKGAKLEYKGHVQASKPQYALWSYKSPVQKEIYINSQQATIIEPDIEQVLIKRIDGDFDFFRLIRNAKKIDKNLYLAKFQEVNYTIKVKNSKIVSISYSNELENHVEILFSKQIQNKKLDKKIFIPNIPTEYDIIRG